ncbi:hypothetical protein [Flavobacterium sp. 11]|uniref:hypothetical protein n=1 Tax=Flavobacterium sp. 11 TaxID=357523 RepID=UPI000C193ACF|nr:hypothetical protein [Flavobacterium sp. 11]PIF60669.1 glycosyltransferase involved in cell wall biosynthesis [Flavobacterium sp. 11]
MNKIYYIGHFLEGFNDGGQSRNKAFREYFTQKDALVLPVYSSNPFVRFAFLLSILRIMLFSKDNEFFIHQGTLIVLFPIPILKYDWIRTLVFKLMEYTSNRNDVTIEVNDLPYEQAKDLELVVQEIYKIFQDKLYNLKNTKYIFASHEMGKYINDKFKLNYEVIINGSNEIKYFSNSEPLHNCFSSAETKFVYAGGLNKGRQIEALISKFNNRKEILILMGEWGEWMLDYGLSDNIFYLGKFQEDYAHYLISKCDVGIIPYDESRFYYNICYPTKASFYITAGIPFLSTPLLELKNVFEGSEMVFFVPFDSWNIFIDNFDKSRLFEIKEKVNKEKHKFYWKDLLSKYFKYNSKK